MSMEEIFGDVIDVRYTLSDALEDGEIIRLDSNEMHKTDCKQFYKCPVYITKALYEKHKEAALSAANNNEEDAKRIHGLTIFDMLNMSIHSYKELSDSIRKFHYHLQKDKFTFLEELTETIAKCGGDDEGKMIITFMLSSEL